MTEAPRYPVTPQHPPMHVRVVVQWDGRVFKAARVVHPHEKRYCWVRRFPDGGERYLPPKINAKAKKKPAHTWSPAPDWWCPENPEAWRAPLPAPLPPIPEWRRVSDEPRMVNIRARRRNAEVGDRAVADASPWWWPGSTAEGAEEIVYGPDTVDGRGRPAISRKMAEGRIMRAAAVSGASGIQGKPKKQQDRTFRDVAEAAAEVEREAELAKESGSRRERFEPGPDDLRDWDTAMAWFAALNPPEMRDSDHTAFALNIEQRVIVWRALRYSWHSIAEQLARSKAYGQHTYRSAIDRVWRVANGREPFPHRKTADHVAEVKRRNTQHHNRERQYD